jgi:ABC transporter substrate binding protein
VKQATVSIPIVGVNLTDPVGFGLIVSEAHPGTNVTGILFRLEGLTAKQVEIALDLMPGARSIGILVDVDNPANMLQRREVEATFDDQLGFLLGAAIVAPPPHRNPLFESLYGERAQARKSAPSSSATTRQGARKQAKSRGYRRGEGLFDVGFAIEGRPGRQSIRGKGREERSATAGAPVD